jgi:hypothetical protein
MLTGSSNGLSSSKPPGLSGDRSLPHRSGVHAMVQRGVIYNNRKQTVNQIIWIVGAVVIVLAILGFLGLR